MPQNPKRRFFLVPPTYFSIEYSINQWMDTKNQVDKDLAQTQWESLRKAYEDLGAEVVSFSAVPGLPDQIFPGDSIFVYGEHAVASRFSVPERAAEVDPMMARFEKLGFEVQQMPEGMHFEGNAEAMHWNGRVLGGFGVRSDLKALNYLGESLNLDLVPLEIHAPYFHLDMCVCPLNEDTLAYVPDAFEDESRARLESLGAELIAIDQDEGLRLACNSMSVNNTVILSTQDVSKFPKALERAGFEVLALDLSEFAKSGGGAKCLTLEAYPAMN